MKIPLALILSFVLWSPSSSMAGDISKWEPVQDGNMVVTVRTIDKDGIHITQYKYHMKAPPLRTTNCNEVQKSADGQEIRLMTQEANPWTYIISSTHNAYKPAGANIWIGVDSLGKDLR